MANIPDNLRYSKDHEWALIEGDTATIGISDYAQHSLGDVVYVDLPAVGATFGAHESIGSVESVKAVSDIFTPVGGEIIEVNEAVNDAPESVNSDAYGAGWLAKLRIPDGADTSDLMDAAQYAEYLSAQE